MSKQITDFSQYLATADRFILSAKFGDGKTYLLNQLRNNQELSDEYHFFTIYPVNYSVARNEDIFEYIKRDIIVQLKEERLLDNVDLNAVFDSLFNFEDVKALVSFLLSFVPGGTFYDKVFQKFCDKKQEYEEKKHTADKYLESFSQIKGSIYEKDGYTLLIRNAIDWMKEDHPMNGIEWKKKKSVLIIEDLNRLDPKHLFRILNVLSAHIDDTTNPDTVTNKFGFNNIVLVMDHETTEHIFHHFYGNEACYEGYMSKFLSRRPIRYSIQFFIRLQIEQKLSEQLGITNIFYQIFPKFREKLSQLSIRDLKKLTLFDTQDRIKRDVYEYGDMKFSTSLPLFHLIIYMVESGMSVAEIIEDLKLRTNSKMNEYFPEIMNLMHPLYAIMKGDFDYYSFGSRHYRITKNTENDVIIGVESGLTMHWDNSIVNIGALDIRDTVKSCLENFSSSINLAALYPYYR